MAHTDRDEFGVVYMADADAMPYPIGGKVPESYMAADIAERVLLQMGTPGKSYAEIRFNGDDEAHTMMFLLEKDQIGVWNTEAASWPVYYPPSDQWGDQMLAGIPWEELENKLNQEDESGEHKTDEEADSMKLEGQDDGDDQEDDESDSDGDEAEDDQEAEDDLEESENGSDGPTEDSESEESNEGDDESDEDGETEEETEMPRLRLFGKMRGPRGWRKRAETEELETRNIFALKVGVMPEDYDPENTDETRKTSQLERDVICHVEFIERDEERQAGLLRFKLPKGVTLDDFNQSPSGMISVTVPYRTEES